MKYIDYRNMKEFYTIAEVCHLFEMDKKELRYYSEKYGFPRRKTCMATTASERSWFANCTTTSTKSRRTTNFLPLRRHRERTPGHEK